MSHDRSAIAHPPSALGRSAGPRSRLVAGTAIEGAELRVLDVHEDARGSFTEVFQEHWSTCVRPVQWSVVRSRPNVFRGAHLHRRHSEYVGVVSGRMVVGLRDLRPWSPTRGCWAMYEMLGEELACVTFPAGVLHGWYFPVGTIHIQAVSEAYAEYRENDNWGCLWSDPALEIPWPISGEPIVIRKSTDFATLAELVEALGDWAPPAQE